MTTAWLLTSTFYGNWLPGDSRGFVGRVWEQRDGDRDVDLRHVHDVPATPYDADLHGLQQASEERMRGPAVLLTLEQAKTLLAQFQETAAYRRWRLCAVAIMANHVHLVVEAPADADPTKILGDFKAYGSRALTRHWGKPASATWWTSKGSKRKLADESQVQAAIAYVLAQHHPLITWTQTLNPSERERVSAP